MNFSILGRVIWKEYRLQRPLWLVVAVLAVLADMLTLCCDPGPFDKMIALHYIALVAPALYVLGCGATMFAGEHETETYEFQRSLPARALQVLIGKVVVVAVSAVALLGLTMLLADRLAPLPVLPQGSPVPWRLLAWATVGFFTVEMFVWAVFFSLLTRRVLVAAILGVSAASIAAHLAAAMITRTIMMETYVQAMPWRAAIAAVVALADVWLAARWFREKRDRHSSTRLATPAATPRQANEFGDRLLGPQRLAILGRLVWQHWRQSRRMSLILVSLFIPLVAILIAWMFRASGYPAWYLHRYAGEIFVPTEQLAFFSGLFLALATVPLFGVGAFLADQRKSSYRFLTDRGVPPKSIWLSRQLVTLAVPMFLFVSLLLGLFLLATALLPAPEFSNAPQWISVSQFYAGTYNLIYFFLSVFGYLLIGITVGQLCSMFLRSPLLAGLMSVLLTVVLVLWCALMLYWRVNWLWSILPIPLVLLLATRLRTADWLVGRNRLRAWLWPCAALLIPAAALLVAVPLYRVYSIPAVDPGFSLDEFAQPLTPQEEKALALYDRAFAILGTPPSQKLTLYWRNQHTDQLTPGEVAWFNANPEPIALALKASRQKIQHRPVGSPLFIRQNFLGLANLLTCSAVVSEKAGQLDAALDRYLAALQLASYLRDWYPIPLTRYERYADLNWGGTPIETIVLGHLPRWATQKGQTPERIIAAARRLEELTNEKPSANAVKLAYLRLQRVLAGDASVIQSFSDQKLFPLAGLWMRLPSEHARAERLLNLLTRSQLEKFSQVEEAVRQGEPFIAPPCGTNVISAAGIATDLPNSFLTGISIPPVVYDAKWGETVLVQDYLARVAAQRAVRIVLALEAWKLKHGSLPKKLDELVGHGLDRLPVDPYSGTPFRYFRDGLGRALDWSQPRLLTAQSPSPSCSYDPFAYDRGKLPRHTPILWSSGNKLRRLGAKERDAYGPQGVSGRYEIFTRIGDSLDTWRRPNSEFDVWESGWPFPIP